MFQLKPFVHSHQKMFDSPSSSPNTWADDDAVTRRCLLLYSFRPSPVQTPVLPVWLLPPFSCWQKPHLKKLWRFWCEPAELSAEREHEQRFRQQFVKGGSFSLACKTHPLCFSLICTLVLMVNPAKVGHNDRNRKRDDEHTAQRTHTTHDLACDRFRHHVTVPAMQKKKELVNLYLELWAFCYFCATVTSSSISWSLFAGF